MTVALRLVNFQPDSLQAELADEEERLEHVELGKTVDQCLKQNGVPTRALSLLTAADREVEPLVAVEQIVALRLFVRAAELESMIGTSPDDLYADVRPVSQLNGDGHFTLLTHPLLEPVYSGAETVYPHLLVHSDFDGIYYPQRFSAPIWSDGISIGSLPQLIKELVAIEPLLCQALGIDKMSMRSVPYHRESTWWFAGHTWLMLKQAADYAARRTLAVELYG